MNEYIREAAAEIIKTSEFYGLNQRYVETILNGVRLAARMEYRDEKAEKLDLSQPHVHDYVPSEAKQTKEVEK